MPASVQRAAEKALQEIFSWGDGYARIQRFFTKVRLEGFKVWCVIDEFDHARHLFKDDISGFQGCASLAYHPDWRITLVTASRRSIRDIELQTKAISTLDGIFMKHYLGMFVPTDIDILLSRLVPVGISVSDELWAKLVHYCGGQPLLLEMLCHSLVEQQIACGRIDIETGATNLQRSFIDYYNQLVDLLREDGILASCCRSLWTSIRRHAGRCGSVSLLRVDSANGRRYIHCLLSPLRPVPAAHSEAGRFVALVARN